MGEATRIFWSNRREEIPSNEDTLFLSPFRARLGARAPLDPIKECHRAIRSWVAQCRPPGLAVAAVDAEGVQARAYLSAKPSVINAAIVGRHARAEIHLGSDPAISLRHLAVIVHPASSKDEVRFRVLDLRTPAGFTDARGASRRAVEAMGPYVAGCGDYAVAFVPVTEPKAAWPDEPERLERAFDFDVLTSPETLERLGHDGREEPLGELVVASHEGTGAVPVSRRAVSAGILLGRAERCDGEALLVDRHISRVHLLIVQIAGKLYAIDTASKNGMFGRRDAERITVLETGTSVSLAGFATVEWRFFH